VSASCGVRRAWPHAVSDGLARTAYCPEPRRCPAGSGHDSDHLQQAVGNFLNVLAAAIGLVACYGGAGVAAGHSYEVAERGPRGYGPLLASSPQMSRALWAACRQASSVGVLPVTWNVRLITAYVRRSDRQEL
jgi:hypothetical protein